MKDYYKICIKHAVSLGYTVDNKGIIYNRNNTVVNGYVHNTGYKVFSIRLDSVAKKRKNGIVFFHRYVAYKKYGDDVFSKKVQVRHLNNNKLDNSWNNIVLGSSSDNRFDMPKSQRIELAIHASSFNRIFTDSEESTIRAFYKLNRSYNKTMKKFNVKKSTLHYIINKQK